MKYSFTNVNITPLFPIKQMGFIQQTQPIIDVHDDLYARIMAFNDSTQFIFLISCDNLGMPLCVQKQIKQLCSSHFGIPCFVTISSTHTHFGADSNNLLYQNQCVHSIFEACKNLVFKEGDLRCSMQTEPFDKIGKSRITNHTAFALIQVLSFFDGLTRVATLIIHNCHPTILDGDTPYFSSEYPGYTISELRKTYPGEFFSFYQGAAGDISTRFTRPSQDYASVIQLSQLLINKVHSVLGSARGNMYVDSLSYEETILNIFHDLSPINLSHIQNILSDREKETIDIGIQLRNQLLADPSSLDKNICISKICLGPIQLIFCPNECFSYYLDAIDTNNSVLVCYSNGYSPYVLGIDETAITYEKFTDTWSNETKQLFFSILKKLSAK